MEKGEVVDEHGTPLSIRTLAWAGAVVSPPIPAFYVGGEELARFLDAYSQRLLDHLGLGPAGPGLRWG